MANPKEKETGKQAAPTPTTEELQETLRILEEEAVEKEDRIANLESTVTKLSEKTQAGAVTKLPVLESGGKKYQLLAPALFIDNEKMTAEDIANDQDTVDYLVEIGSGALKAL